MSNVIDEDFTHNEMIIEGKDAVNFFRNFQHVMHESRYFNVTHTKKIEYEFRYHGKPNHDYLVLVKKEFPFVKFEIKGYYYPDEPYCGIEEIFLYNNKGIHHSIAKDVGISYESDDQTYERYFKTAKNKIRQNKSRLN